MRSSRSFVFVCAVLVVSLVAGAWQPVMAQQASPGAGYLGKSRSEYSIFVFGDSLAAGLWAGSQRAAKGNRRLKIKGRFKEGSGLARPQYHDWASALPKIIERNPMDIAVILIGSNDRQSVRQGEKTLEFGSDEWTEYYQGRVDQILQVLKSNKVAAYWVELPPMGSTHPAAWAPEISKLHRSRVTAAKLRFVEIRKAFANPDGSYVDRGFGVDGKFKRLRSTDGVHFLKSGNTKIAKMVIDVINKDIEVSDGVREAEPDTVAAVDEPDLEGKPIFGYSLGSGEPATLDPADLPKADAITIARATLRQPADGAKGVTGTAVIKSLRTTAILGSAAGRLFVDGEWPEVPAGRMDDFSWPVE